MSDLFDNFKEIMLGGGNHGPVDLAGDNIKALGIDHGDVDPNLSSHEDRDDISAGEVLVTANLSNVSVTDGAFDHDNEETAGVSGDQFESICYIKDSGSAATSALIAKIDAGTGLPFTPSGGAVDLRPDASGVFAL